jgi:hypothetical protein
MAREIARIQYVTGLADKSPNRFIGGVAGPGSAFTHGEVPNAGWTVGSMATAPPLPARRTVYAVGRLKNPYMNEKSSSSTASLDNPEEWYTKYSGLAMK